MAKKKIICENCPFFTGVKCHGHGEFWGNCILVDQAYKILEKRAGRKHYISSGYRDIVYDVSECLFIKLGLFEIRHI